MKRLISLALSLAICGLVAATQAVARPITSYQYLTDIETTVYGEIIWFWTPDTMFGPVHSNDFIGLKYSPSFYGPVSTCKSEFRYYNPGNIYFAQQPVFNAPPVNFDRELTYIREHANIRIDDHGGRLMTWIKLRGDEGIDIYQYTLGMERDDSLITHLSPPNWTIIWVDGELELEGDFRGVATIAARKDVWLLDNVRYADSDIHGGFDENECRDLLGVASEGNIIIADNERNGKWDGANAAPNNENRHSIALNGSYVALGESFTFEHQNDEWDLYKSPTTPDERGYIWLKGSLAQKRRGYLHRRNHVGTGYGRSFRYDSRLSRVAPPGLAIGEIFGNQDRVELLSGSHDVYGCRIRTLIVHPGVELTLQQGNLVVTDSLVMVGTGEDSIQLHAYGAEQALLVESGARYALVRNVTITGTGEYRFEGEETILDHVVSSCPISCEGSAEITKSDFGATVTLTGYRTVSVSGSVFRQGLALRGNPRTCVVDRCTMVGGSGVGVSIRGGVESTISNCIIAYNRIGIAGDGRYDPIVRYSDVYDNQVEDYQDCDPGVGSISVDPLFVSRRHDNYQLDRGSPCIDSGDPAAPLDPDGTRADMGAFYFDHVLSASGKEFGIGNLEFGMSAAPNPFNSAATVRISLPKPGDVQLVVKDLNGRTVKTILEQTKSAGEWAASLDGAGWPNGVYIVRATVGSEMRSLKLVKVN